MNAQLNEFKPFWNKIQCFQVLHTAWKLVICNSHPYIKPMNRRRFLQSLAAVFTLPAGASLSLPSISAVAPAAVAVPTKARFWAIYMSSLHGECTPQTLQNLLHIPGSDAKKYVGQLIADGVIKPNPLLKQSVSKIMQGKDDTLLDKVKKRSEMKSDAKRKIASEPMSAQDTDHQEEAAETPPDEGSIVETETELSAENESLQTHEITSEDEFEILETFEDETETAALEHSKDTAH